MPSCPIALLSEEQVAIHQTLPGLVLRRHSERSEESPHFRGERSDPSASLSPPKHRHFDMSSAVEPRTLSLSLSLPLPLPLFLALSLPVLSQPASFHRGKRRRTHSQAVKTPVLVKGTASAVP